MLLLNRWCTILSFASVLAVMGAHPLVCPFRFPSIFFSGFLSPPSLYLSSANHVLPFIAWRVSLGLNWLYAFSLVLFVFSEGNRAHEANTLSRQAIHTPSRISAAGRLASSSRRLGNYTLRKQDKIQSLAFAAKAIVGNTNTIAYKV